MTNDETAPRDEKPVKPCPTQEELLQLLDELDAAYEAASKESRLIDPYAEKRRKEWFKEAFDQG
jgi:hypothetical protein